jgi:aromatic ring-opening dioxygenase catalytic subunit (LigB family)
MDWTWGPADTWEATRRFLAGLATTLPAQPKAIVVVSGHWEETAFTASTASEPELIYDYSGFPEHTYKLTWPAPGAPDLARRIAELLGNAGLPAGISPSRGFDHGVFVPLKVAFPEARIPVVSLSLVVSRPNSSSAHNLFDPELHLAAGRALAPLRDEGILLIASGMSFHNLRAYLQPQTLVNSREFDTWLTAAVESPEETRSKLLASWREAPSGIYAHPREEHLIPLLVAVGAGGDGPGRRIFNDEPMGAAISAYRFGD